MKISTFPGCMAPGPWLRGMALRARVCSLAWALLLTAPFIGCGGGVGEEGTGLEQPSASVGVLQGLSEKTVTVNGVSYSRSEATLTDGFGQPLPEQALGLGMWLEVIGRIDDSGRQGVADSIRVRAAARGVVSASSPGRLTLTVFDSSVRLSAGTVLEGAANVSALAAGDLVEVHGPLSNAAGDVSASRVEKLRSAPAPADGFELRGRVSQLDTINKTMLVGRRAVSYASARLTLRAALANGQTVRVSATTAPVGATPWAVARLTSDLALPANLSFLYTEGFVDELRSGPAFNLEDLPVDATSAEGKSAVTSEGLRVAVVGALNAGVLKAKSLVVVQPGEPVVFTLGGPVAEFVSSASFKVRNVAIDASAATFASPLTPAGLANGVRVRITGTVQGRGLLASRVEALP